MEDIAQFDFENPDLEAPDTELAIGTATRLLLLEEADSIKGTHRELSFFFQLSTSFIMKLFARWFQNFHLVTLLSKILVYWIQGAV